MDTGKTYKVNGNLNCNSQNVIYLTTCKNCSEQFVGSAINFKDRFRVRKSDIKTGKTSCDAAKHFIMTCSTQDKFEDIRIKLIENVHCDNISKLESMLWQREKDWQTQLIAVSKRYEL